MKDIASATLILQVHVVYTYYLREKRRNLRNVKWVKSAQSQIILCLRIGKLGDKYLSNVWKHNRENSGKEIS